MLSPQGGEEKLGSQILLLIDTWVNIILAEGKGKKKDQCWYFYHVPGTDGEKLKTQFCDSNEDCHLQGQAGLEAVRAGAG